MLQIISEHKGLTYIICNVFFTTYSHGFIFLIVNFIVIW